MLRRRFILATAAVFLVLGAACTSEDDASPTPTESPPGAATLEPVTDLTLQNATIPTDLVTAGEVNLQGGEATVDGAEFTIANTVIDDFNEDGGDDGAMIVRSSGGGPSTFYDLYVFLAAEGSPEMVASQFLGDRIEVQGIESGPGGVTVVYLDRPADALTTDAPTVETTARVEIGSDGSISVSGSASATGEATEVASASPTATTTAASEDACADLAPEAVDAAFTFVTNLQSGDTLESGASVEGCSRTFESNVPWRLEDRDGNVIAESFTMGGGVDGPAPYEFTVEYEVDEPQVGHLFVGGDDPSGGEGFPPVLNQIPVVLLP